MSPIQSVTVRNNQSVCYVQNSSDIQLRVVEVGDYNDKFIEIKNGLKEGDQVVLNTSGLSEKYQPSIEQQKDAIVPGPKLDKATTDEKAGEQLEEQKPKQGRPVASENARPS